jgi:hypothetical protein
MSQFAISFAAFCTAGQKRNESTTRCIEAAQQWCKRNDYVLEQYPEREDASIAAFAGSSVILGCLHLVQYRLERAYIAPGTVLILEMLNGLPLEARLSVITLLMDLMQHGLALVTLRDGKLWNPAVLEDFCQFVMSVTSMFGDDADSSAVPTQGGD